MNTSTTCLSAVDVSAVDDHLTGLLLEEKRNDEVAGQRSTRGAHKLRSVPSSRSLGGSSLPGSPGGLSTLPTRPSNGSSRQARRECVVLFDTHLMSPRDKASVLRRAAAASAEVVFVAPFLDADDTAIALRGSDDGAFRSRVLRPKVLYASSPTHVCVAAVGGWLRVFCSCFWFLVFSRLGGAFPREWMAPCLHSSYVAIFVS